MLAKELKGHPTYLRRSLIMKAFRKRANKLGVPLIRGQMSNSAEFLGLTWKTDIYGTWLYEITAFKIGEGFVPTVGSDGTGMWHFVPFPSLEFLVGEASFTVPSPGQYWFFISPLPWLAPFPPGEFQAVLVDVGP